MPENRLSSNSSTIDQIAQSVPRGGYQAVLFDWDGTISLIREGWRGIMVSMMVEELLELATGESEDELNTAVAEYVDRLTGKQTIYQMLQLCDEIRIRNGTPEEARVYNKRFKELLNRHIADRIQKLLANEIEPSDLMLPGIIDLLQNLRDRGMVLYLASGTDHESLLRESALLGLSGYFGGRIFGAREEHQSFSKALVVQRILKEQRIAGNRVLGFGDGPVEIENIKAVGGTAIGVAIDESTGKGIDSIKRHRLIKAGADFIIPDYCEQEILISFLAGEH